MKHGRMLRRCKMCILPETFTGITFDEEGLCNFCSSYVRPKKLGKERLIEEIKQVKGKGPYDCVIPLSGGKDSTYTLYCAVRELKLMPIAVHYDNGFLHETALRNIDNACRILGVPLFRRKADQVLQRLMLRQILRFSEKMGLFIHTCGSCEAFLRTTVVRAVKQYGTPAVLWGSTGTQAITPEVNRNYRQQVGFIKKARQGQSGLVSAFSPKRFAKALPYLCMYLPLLIYQRIQMGVPMRSVISPAGNVRFSTTIARFIYVEDYIDLDNKECVLTLKRELEWEHPRSGVSRFDCRLHCFPNYRFLQTEDITYDGITYANTVRAGYMSRGRALAAEQERMQTVERECRELCKEIGLRNYRMPQRRADDCEL